MFPPPTYYVILVLCWMYALLRGGNAERVGATILILGSAFTMAAATWSGNRFRSIDTGMVLVDAVVFAVFTILALRADRFWPIWASAFAGLGLLAHLGRWYAGPEISAWAYWFALIIGTYPTLAGIAIGTRNVQRQRRAGLGVDKPWSS